VSETEYFVNLVLYARAGSKSLREHFLKIIKKQQEKSTNVMERGKFDRVLDEKSQAQFYSHWYYSGIRLLTSIPDFQNADRIANFLGLPNKTVGKTIDFLLRTGLCKIENGKLAIGEARTYVGADSIFVNRHHINWRMKSLGQIDSLDSDELMYTNPVTVSKADFPKIREKIVEFIQEFGKAVHESPSEEMAVLNIDWVKVKASPK
jgi:uncharacterized protein (TIGR02147 family)